ncbi:hypothetical protein [Nitrospira sp. Ecomares 2.1]
MKPIQIPVIFHSPSIAYSERKKVTKFRIDSAVAGHRDRALGDDHWNRHGKPHTFAKNVHLACIRVQSLCQAVGMGGSHAEHVAAMDTPSSAEKVGMTILSFVCLPIGVALAFSLRG